MSLKDALNEKRFDIRLQDKLVNESKLTPQEIEKYLKEVADDGGNKTTTTDSSAPGQKIKH